MAHDQKPSEEVMQVLTVEHCNRVGEQIRGGGEGQWNTMGKVFEAIGRQLEDSWKLIGT